MSKPNYCDNGKPVTDQVILFQQSRKSDDFTHILEYYDNFKDVWFLQLKDYMDRDSFDSEFDFRLFKAVDSFNCNEAQKNANKKGLDYLGNFNRWFYKILTNWKSNVKTSAYRMKKCPSVTCPVCGRKVGRITATHLQHFKTVSDLPKFMTWSGEIYEVFARPRVYAICWGKRTNQKFNDLLTGKTKIYMDEKKRVKWPWRTSDGQMGVLCPFTKKIVKEITDEHLQGLPDKYNRYTTPVSWEDFLESHPKSLIQSEIYSLDVSKKDSSDVSMKDKIISNTRVGHSGVFEVGFGNSDTIEHVFSIINKHISDKRDIKILECLASGFEIDEIAEMASCDKKEIRKRIKSIRDCHTDLKYILSSQV